MYEVTRLRSSVIDGQGKLLIHFAVLINTVLFLEFDEWMLDCKSVWTCVLLYGIGRVIVNRYDHA